MHKSEAKLGAHRLNFMKNLSKSKIFKKDEYLNGPMQNLAIDISCIALNRQEIECGNKIRRISLHNGDRTENEEFDKE